PNGFEHIEGARADRRVILEERVVPRRRIRRELEDHIRLMVAQQCIDLLGGRDVGAYAVAAPRYRYDGPASVVIQLGQIVAVLTVRAENQNTRHAPYAETV